VAAAKPLSSPFKALLYLKKLFFQKIPAVILLTDESINKHACRKIITTLPLQLPQQNINYVYSTYWSVDFKVNKNKEFSLHICFFLEKKPV
jgi:hypothetical protein